MNCKERIKTCGAWCCRGFSIKIPKGIAQIIMKQPFHVLIMQLSPDMQKYFRLHDCEYDQKKYMLKIPLRTVVYDVEKGVLYVLNECLNLGNSSCLDYEHRPYVCRNWRCDQL